MLSLALVVVLTVRSGGGPLLHRQANPAEGGTLGYYRTPAVHGKTIVFTSEGDLWKVDASGGIAQRLTTHPSTETDPAISPDGRWIAFTASYEGPSEAYVMPIDGGLPTRLTYGGADVVGWTPSGKVIYTTGEYSTLPSAKLGEVDPKSLRLNLIPLAQAHDGSFNDDGSVLFFTRFSFQGSQTKRYQGGTAQSIWRWDGGASEAKPLTGDFKGTSRSPMWWNGRVYFASDRDGVMNIWSMDANGHDLKEHTHHTDYDIESPSLSDGVVVYQYGADICKLDLHTGLDAKLPIRLVSDFDQMRETWVKNPGEWVTSAHLSEDGTRIALTARGQVFVAPVKQGRLIETTRAASVRYRNARFMPDGKSLVTFSDESGEVELWKLDPLGTQDVKPQQLTRDSTVLRLDEIPSPDGKWIAHTDRDHRLYLYDVLSGRNKKIADSQVDDQNGLTWSPDSKYIAYVEAAHNLFEKIKLYCLADGSTTDVTTDRYNSESPGFSSDGKFLYFLSDRHLQTVVGSPWGPRAPQPFYDKETEVLYVSLQPGNRSPFLGDDELHPAKKEPEAATKGPLPAIDLNGISTRLGVVPIPAGNYRALSVCGSRLYMISSPGAGGGSSSLVSLVVRNQNIKLDTIQGNVSYYETTQDGKKIMSGAGAALYVFDANGAPPDLGEARVNLDGWTFSFDPREEWRQMFNEAWRLHRDWLYAANMQGVNWPAMRKKYLPLVDRVTDRTELSDVLAQMVGEVSLLHTFVNQGDHRSGTDNVEVARLGAMWERSDSLGGYKITRIYRTDPDTPEEEGPLLRQGVDLSEGDVITEIDGVPTLSVPNASALLRAKAGRQTRLKVLVGGRNSSSRDVIVAPLSGGQDGNLRYTNWEYSRRQTVEKDGGNQIGYVHLRAMGSGDMNQFERDFYPVFDRQGLIIDVRHNNGGNIDSWILGRLMRKAWMLWNQHKGEPTWNMQYAFRGHIVVLCDENTASDGEAFTEGFRRLGLGKVIGTRTWGGEVWLSGDNTLVDRGVATAAENGVFGPEGKWLIEGHGVDPDIVIDNLPRATFDGQDAQLAEAIRVLKDEIAKHPNPVPAVPPFPDKSFPIKKRGG